MHVNTYMYVYVHMCVHVYVQVCICGVCVNTCVCKYANIYPSVHACILVVSVYVYSEFATCVFIYSHIDSNSRVDIL